MRCGHDCSAWDHDEKWGDEADVARFNATVAVLLAAGADVNAICFDWPGPQYDYTPLQFAVESRNLQIVKMLVEHGADMNIKESDGRTALEIAYEFKKMGPQWEKEYNQKYEMDGIIEYLESVMK